MPPAGTIAEICRYDAFTSYQVLHGGARMLKPQPGHIALASRDAPTNRPPVLRFDPQRRAVSPGLLAVINDFLGYLEAEEHRMGKRTRQRRENDRRSFRVAAEVLVCNLLAAAMASKDAIMSVPRGHAAMWGRGRYRNPVYGQHFLDLLDLLREIGLIEQTSRGYWFSKTASQPTTIRPAAKFAALFPLHALTSEAFRQEDEPELIVLRQPKDGDGQKPPIEYKDTQRTRQWRREVARLNAYLRDAPLAVAGTDLGAITLDRHGQPVEAYRRSLQRIFNNASWQHGGRLFGGFWMTMERESRFQFLRIGGERVVNVDFSSLFPRLAYVRGHAEQPESDLYDIAGDGSCRDGWKQLVNALLFAQRPLKQWPDGTKELFPAGLSLKDAIAAIKAKHAAIAHLFEQGFGFQLMRFESDMLIVVVTALFAKGIPALPLHDSVLVANSQGEIAQHLMETEFQRRTGASRAYVKIDLGSN